MYVLFFLNTRRKLIFSPRVMIDVDVNQRRFGTVNFGIATKTKDWKLKVVSQKI